MIVQAWRIVQAHLAERAFDGEGARLYGGRWNHVGTPVVYTAGSRALAMLELLAHASPQFLKRPFVVFPLAFGEDDVERVEPDSLPDGWSAHPARDLTKDVGTRWVSGGGSIALEVPSALVPEEQNYLLNPRHPLFSTVDIGEPEPLHVDERFCMRG